MLDIQNSPSSPFSALQIYGSYSRLKENGTKENWREICDRTLHSPETGLFAIASFTAEEENLIEEMMLGDGTPASIKALGSGRWLWIGGTKWIRNPENWHGAFNCVTLNLDNINAFGTSMNLSACGCGVGINLERKYIDLLPPVITTLSLSVCGVPQGVKSLDTNNFNNDFTIVSNIDNAYFISVGDSRVGWSNAYQALINLATTSHNLQTIKVTVDISRIRPAGSALKGFGGVANPERVPLLFERTVSILNKAVGRQLNALECCLLVDEAGLAIVAGNIRRVAGIRQGDAYDQDFTNAKLNLWTQSNGKWKIDPEREALKVANHTRVFHHIPTKQECIDAIRSQFFTGEGAIQWAGEAVARANADLLKNYGDKDKFLDLYGNKQVAASYLADKYFLHYKQEISEKELTDRMNRYGLNPCGEMIASNNHCNLATVHLTNIEPSDINEQKKAFRASALNAVAPLHRNFSQEVFAESRDIDPIVIVSFTQGFEFFARLFDIDWLRWWQAGRPFEWGKDITIDFPNEDFSKLSKIKFDCLSQYFLATEARYLKFWKTIVEQTVQEYCDRNGLKCPNRCTGLKPEGSLTLLTGTGMCGLHPPKSWRYIRRKEVPKNSPLALAAIDFGFSVMPSNGDKDADGNLLDDPYSPLCNSWVVEAPVEEKLVTLIPAIEKEGIDPSKFSCLAQINWFMQVQNFYTTHNTSCTPEIRKHEIEEVGEYIHNLIVNNGGYVSMAFLARHDEHQSFPRMPFEPISKQRFDYLQAQVIKNRKSSSFSQLLSEHLQIGVEENPLDSACDSSVCNI
ncbi:ribonucleoside-triphosphate reductase, adenosylcobalamin-dependent (plasmid) [Nostoc sp. C052]|uniref:ribonucleoside-triphosphate reductase, adenosylcobalamin-dependent n=1 Tax=Nostoc sp. C052 TaxID=2576902 RepID=UPI0015C387FD|nr:ribonucleoside-triphosphate reductase, adenosylcobalamin-dependent [Nostoc sp. C052]QLE46462.1 ribonucleoside-triphosphate reductase, adenosylcobalamin-dependent [Nostoc sp. C052]